MRRTPHLLTAVVLAAIVFSPPWSPGPAVAAPRTAPLRYVVIMSFDGARADAVAQVFPAGLRAKAAFSWDAQTTLPSSTLPSHTSMLTGVPPSVHGVRFNAWTPRQPYLALPTVFSLVTASGGKAAAFVAKSKLLFLARPGTTVRAEYLAYPRYDMVEVARLAARYLAQERPNLLFVHVADPDAAGHADGWMSQPYMRTIRKMPEAITAVLDVLSRLGALDDSLLIVTADHGGHGRTHGTADPDDTTIPWLAFGAVQPGPIARPIVTYDTAATALAALGVSIPAFWQGTPILEPVGSRR